ncbi:MAG: protease complex subunit PrcB family protein [Planctomycetota bacterium]|nr:protease complex subunit PrcB family protein [Planctomycetota bacterium]
MSLILTILIFSMFSCVALADGSFPKVISQAVGPKGDTKPQGIIIKTEAELSKFLDLPEAEANTKIKQLLNVKELNFANQMILIIQGGECKSGGFKVVFEEFQSTDNSLQVLWKLQAPATDAFVTQALAYPSLVLLVENFKGEISFKQIIDIKK